MNRERSTVACAACRGVRAFDAGMFSILKILSARDVCAVGDLEATIALLDEHFLRLCRRCSYPHPGEDS